ncbi:MAG: capsule assembly Wzi family protein [Leeuwenhoekiella sp.]
MTFGQGRFYGDLSGEGFVNHGGENPFWFTSNQFGRVNVKTSFFLLAESGYTKQFNPSNDLKIHAGMRFGDGLGDDIFVDQFYVKYRYKNVLINIGSWHRANDLQELSSVGGDILWSGNSRALPGAQIQFLKGARIFFDWLTLNGTLGHYFFSNDRFVENAQLHYKNISLKFRFSGKSRLRLSVDHYAQYGGTSPAFGKQPTGFSNYLRVFVGSNGSNNATVSDQANALGNHLGSYKVTYDLNQSTFNFRLYHQTIFEDASGRELRNFPDGVWGIYFKSKTQKLFEKFLYEYVQTVSQSGKFVPPPNGNFRGGDNYFGNGIYQSGWTFKNRIIGLPFIIPNEDGRGIKINRSYVHHLSVSGNACDFNYIFKMSYVRNLGTYSAPLIPSEEAFYSYFKINYPTVIGNFHAQIALDLGKNTGNIFGGGLGYSIHL